ncbi:MAG: diguanylate cyclase [Cellvibrionaceae bacterium]
MKILLVEDTHTLQEMMRFQLEDLGHEVVIADNGKEAVSLIKTQFDHDNLHIVDLILMDVEMPIMDGYEATRKIREYLKRHWLPIIFTTALSNDEHYRQGAEAGGDDYLIKPVSPVILETKLQTMERLVDLYKRLEASNESLAKLSTEDPLTGLLNRRAFTDRAEQAINMCVRDGLPIAAMMCDVDHFKAYNDHYGHQQGDQCLIAVAQALKDCSHRDSDVIARYGGEEFVMLLPNTDVEGAKVMAQRVLDNLAIANITHDHSSTANHVTSSVGVATTKSVCQIDLNDILDFADSQLYNAKKAGRNRYMVDTYKPPKNILVVDDSNIDLEIVDTLLSQSARVIMARSGAEALELMDKTHIDMVFLDVMMPDMNGYEVCQKLRANKATSHIPIVFISSCDEEELKRGAKEHMGNGYLHKPYSEKEILQKVARHID